MALIGALDVVPGSDVLIDLNAGPVRLKYWRQPVEDCRLFVLRGGIYVLCNEEMKLLRVRRKSGGHGRRDRTGGGGRGNDHSVTDSTPFTGNDTRLPYRYPNIYGNGLEITILATQGKISGGKNFNIFRSRSHPNPAARLGETTGRYDYFLQIWPSPHVFNQLYVPAAATFRAVGRTGGVDKATRTSNSLRPKQYAAPKESMLSPTPAPPLPEPSFRTSDQSHMILLCEDDDGNPTKGTNCSNATPRPFFPAEEHGSACCVSLNLDGVEVMVGISHAKLSLKNPMWQHDVLRRYGKQLHDQFVSRFVAYSMQRPFDIVARSGWFCLGFGTDEEATRAGGSTLAGKNTAYRLLNKLGVTRDVSGYGANLSVLSAFSSSLLDTRSELSSGHYLSRLLLK